MNEYLCWMFDAGRRVGNGWGSGMRGGLDEGEGR